MKRRGAGGRLRSAGAAIAATGAASLSLLAIAGWTSAQQASAQQSAAQQAGALQARQAAASLGTTAPPPAVFIILDIDTSEEGSGTFYGMLNAAAAYVQALPPNVRVGIIPFNNQALPELPLTTDHRAIELQIGNITKAGTTSGGLASALSKAESQLAALPRGTMERLLIFSMGEAHIAGPGVKVATPAVTTDVIDIYKDRDDAGMAVRGLAAGTSDQFSVYTTPDHAAAAQRLLGATGNGPLTMFLSSQQLDSYIRGLAAQFPLARIAPPPKQHKILRLVASGPAPAPWRLPGVLAVFFVGLALIFAVVLSSLGKQARGRQLAGMLRQYGPHRSVPAPKEDRKVVVGVAVSGMSHVLQSSSTEQKLGQRLQVAGITRQPAEWALIGSGASALLAVLIGVLSGNILIGLVLGLIIGGIAMRLILSFVIGRRRAVFSDQLPDALQRIAGSLRSGLSLPQAIDGIVREDEQPTAGEFGRALAEVRIGLDIDVALQQIADRMDSDDLRWTVMAIRIHREVGGNLAEILDTTAATMRDRAAMRRHVRALSAEGRLSAYILVALPIVLGTWLFLTDRKYLRPLYTTGIGLAMIIGAVVLIVIGTLWMRKVIKVEV